MTNEHCRAGRSADSCSSECRSLVGVTQLRVTDARVSGVRLIAAVCRILSSVVTPPPRYTFAQTMSAAYTGCMHLQRVLAMVILSWCLTRPGTDCSPGEIETSVSHHIIAYSLWAKGSPGTMGRNRGTPLKKRYSTVIGSSNVNMVEDRHRHPAYHNKHWRRASKECQHR